MCSIIREEKPMSFFLYSLHAHRDRTVWYGYFPGLVREGALILVVKAAMYREIGNDYCRCIVLLSVETRTQHLSSILIEELIFVV